jgi:hypothetical protein
MCAVDWWIISVGLVCTMWSGWVGWKRSLIRSRLSLCYVSWGDVNKWLGFFFFGEGFFCFAAVGRKQKLLCRNVITAAVKRILSRSGYVSNALWPNTFFFVFFLFSFLPFDLFACSLENLKKGMKNQIRKSKSKEMTNCDSNPVPICLPARWIVSTFFGEVRCWNS